VKEEGGRHRLTRRGKGSYLCLSKVGAQVEVERGWWFWGKVSGEHSSRHPPTPGPARVFRGAVARWHGSGASDQRFTTAQLQMGGHSPFSQYALMWYCGFSFFLVSVGLGLQS
jgi:hypothetical protein